MKVNLLLHNFFFTVNINTQLKFVSQKFKKYRITNKKISIHTDILKKTNEERANLLTQMRFIKNPVKKKTQCSKKK